ncbi:MAG TPA: tetratricopeptide repeat protein [Candidatus Angelobacter sp.]|nr:tetratricopeptide repeat protein [Candidatus Angelobacter sp.]
MNVWKLLAPIGLLLSLSACGPEPTLNPLFSENDIVIDDDVVGTWVSSDATADNMNQGRTLTFTKLGNKAYEFIFPGDEEGSKFRSEVHLVRLGKFLFLDMYPAQSDSGEARLANGPQASPEANVHFFGRIWIEKQFVRIALLDDRYAERIAAEKKLHFVSVEGETVLAASTRELQEFALQHAEDTKAFSLEVAMCRSGVPADDCATAIFKQKLALNDPEAWDSLGQKYSRAGQEDEALAAFRRAAKLDPSGGSDLHNYHYDIGRVLLKKAQYEEARSEFLEAHRLRPTDSTPDHHIGVTYFLEGRFEDAVRGFKTDPWDASCADQGCPARAHFGGRYRDHRAILATLALRHLGRSEEARAELNAYIQLDLAKYCEHPEWESLLLNYEAGMATEPELIGKAETLEEKSDAFFYVGYEYLLKGNRGKAREYFQKTVDTKVADSDEYAAAQARLNLNLK